MKKYILSLTVLVVAVAAMAFTNVETPAPASTTTYQFQGDDLSEIRDLSLWTEVPEEIEGCVFGELPCYVSTEMSISDWLNARNDQEIVEDADGKKN